MKEGQRPVGPLAQNEYLCTFRYYDSKGRRLTICARQEGEMLKVVVLTLSDEPDPQTNELDTFSRKRGRSIYEQHCLGKEGDDACKGLRFDVPVVDNDPRLSFFKWCMGRYYKLETKVVPIAYRMTYLVRPGKTRLHSKKLVKPEKEKVESKSEETAQ